MDQLSTNGSIATFIVNSIPGLPDGISGNAILLVDLARQHVSQYTGVNIPQNGIQENYQSIITNFAFANVLDLILSQYGGTSLSLGELSMTENGQLLTAQQYRQMGELQLKTIGRHVAYARSLS